MTRSWRFHGKKNTSGGEISALWARSNPVSSPKTPAGCPNPEKHFSKISPGEFSKTGAMQGGGVIFEPPLYLSLQLSHLCGIWICILLISVHFFVNIKKIVINDFINNSFVFIIELFF